MGNTLVPGKASEAELSRMMETYGAMLTGTCTVLLGDRHLAQDIVQETFIRAYKKMDSFRGERPESEKAWLTRIAVNLCRDERRKKWFRFEDRTIPVEMMTLSAPEASGGGTAAVCGGTNTAPEIPRGDPAALLSGFDSTGDRRDSASGNRNDLSQINQSPRDAQKETGKV